MNSPSRAIASSPQIERLCAADLVDALELSTLAGWNQTTEDWLRLLTLAPDGCFSIKMDQHVVATTTLVTFHHHCAWIGMVLTHPNWRGRGFARALVQHALDIARQLGTATVKLDATEQGRPLYESLGFSAEQDVERWERLGGSAPSAPLRSYSLTLDKLAYGYNRSQVLSSLAAADYTTDAASGYALTRPGRIHHYLGPCIAADGTSARRLLEPILDTEPQAGWFWDLLPANHDAAALAMSLGFQPARRLVRMRVGRRLKEQEQYIYALAGLEFG